MHWKKPQRYHDYVLVLSALDRYGSLTGKQLHETTRIGRSALYETLAELRGEGLIDQGLSVDRRVGSYAITEEGKGRLILPGVLALKVKISSPQNRRLIESHVGRRGITKIEAVFSKQGLPAKFYAYAEKRVKGGRLETLRAKIPQSTRLVNLPSWLD